MGKSDTSGDVLSARYGITTNEEKNNGGDGRGHGVVVRVDSD